MGQVRFKIGEDAVVLLDEAIQSVQLLQNAICAHRWGRWCPEWQVFCKINLADASERANAAVVLILGREGKVV
jgi:hypothetical protein